MLQNIFSIDVMYMYMYLQYYSTQNSPNTVYKDEFSDYLLLVLKLTG